MALIAKVLFWPTLWWNQLLKSEKPGAVKRNWFDRVDDHVLLGALPYAKLVPKLKDEGVTHVLNMVAEWGGPVKEYQAASIEQRRVPVIDFTPPSVADIEQASAYINTVVEKGGTVYVHCKAGRGRAASAVMGFLIRYRGMTPLEAQNMLMGKRPHILHVLHARPVMQEFFQQFGNA
eukprot:CAMPEP_0180136684 /NCGR_PEP_ID=MMETSP0986-20121125/11682_1 /TAXON_ID=697907 /ORGANISM="non described non described, Strain CCMP2293" /LENGTH=176 /DNA_ID=CAMNT_0022077839 /DNA_START=63 /DNA_END=593 /DNA_ORIENTATION=-